jgi:site-specific DNA recombinase
VQAIKGRYTSHAGNRRQTKKRLLTGLVKCGSCGGSMTIVNRERYYCSAKRERGTCDSSAGIGANELEERVLTGLRDILLGNEQLIDSFVETFRTEVVRLRRQRGAIERQNRQELDKVKAAIRRCLAFITGGDGDPGLVRDELRSLEARKRELERTQASLDDDRVIDIHPNLSDLYRRKVTELQSLLTDEAACYEAMKLIRSLVERIEVHEGEKRGKAAVVLVGALASILAFTQNETAAQNLGGGRILMVAGAGFEPATFRL